MRDLNMKLFDPANKELKRCEKIADKVIALEAEYKALSEEELKNKTVLFRERLAKGETLEDIMVYSFGAEFKGKRQKEYLEHLENLEDGDYKRFLHSMERNSKMGLINGMIEQEADLLLLFKPEQIAQPLNMLMKPVIYSYIQGI